MARSPFALDQGFLERKAGEETQLALQNMEDYSRNYFEATKPAQDAQAARMQADMESQIANPVGRVLAGSAADLNRGMGEFFGKLSNIASVIEMETGMKAGGLFGRFKKEYLDNATYWDRMVQKRGPTEDILMSIVGGALPGIVNFFPGPAGVAVAGAGGYAEKRMEGKDRGEAFMEGLKDAAHRWAVGKVFHALGGQPMGTKGGAFQPGKKGFFEGGPGTELSTYGKNVLTMGGIGAADTMLSSGLQAGPADVAKGAVSMGVLGAMGGPKDTAGRMRETAGRMQTENRAEDVTNRYGAEPWMAENIDPAQRAKNAATWRALYLGDPAKWGPKTPYDTPEVILARENSRNLPETIQIETPEREALRQEKADELYGSGAIRKERQAYVFIGPPSSNKSTFAKPLAKETGAITIDADDVKPKLPEWDDGRGAGVVHKESAEIATRIFTKAIDNGDNIVYPIVGKGIDSARGIIDGLKASDYNVHLILTDLPADKSAERSVKRYYETGRFVDPVYILNDVRDLPRKNFETLIKEGGLSSHAAYDTDVPIGQKPTPIPEWTSRSEAGPLRVGGAADGAAPEGAPPPEGSGIQTQVPVNFGSRTSIHHADGRDAARFALVDAGDIQSSHDPLRNFQLNPAYPGNEVTAEGRNRMLAQERPYHLDQDLQGKVRGIADAVRPEFLVTDNPDPINGPPIVTPNMMVPGGNRRAMALRLMYEQNPEQAAVYKNYLAQNAERFGLDPAQVAAMDRPVLTRMLMNAETDADVNAFTRKVRLYNQSFTAGLEANSEYVSKARLLSNDSLRILADGLTGDTTLREYLGNAKSYELFKSLVGDGVIEEAKVSTYFNEKTGTLTQQGKSLIEGVLRGKVIDDIDLLAAAPPAALQRIDRAVPFLAKVKGQEGWDISGPMKTALEEYAKYKRTPFSTADEYLAQQSLFGATADFMKDAQAVRLFKMLDGMTPTQFAGKMAGYARAAELAAKVKDQGSLGFFKPMDPADAFRKYVEGDAVIDAAASPAVQYRAAEALMERESPKVVLGELSENIMSGIPAVEARGGRSLKGQFEQGSLIVPENDLPLFSGRPERIERAAAKGIDTTARTLDQLDLFGNLERAPEAAEMVRTLGKKIDESLIETGEINWNGVKVESIHDLALAAQIYRDPRWETHRVFYAKQNEDGTYTILHHAGLTQRLPDRCLAVSAPPGVTGTGVIAAGVESVERNMAKYGATHVFMSHNHPGTTGGVLPSKADRVLEHTWADRLGEKFAGSVIIDGENCRIAVPRHENSLGLEASSLSSALKANGVKRLVPFSYDFLDVPGPDKFAGQAIPHEKIGTVVNSAQELAAHVKDLSTNPDYAVLIVRGSQGQINLIQEVHKDILADIEKARPLIQEAGRNNGGEVLIYMDKETADALSYRQLKDLQDGKLVTDIVMPGGIRTGVPASRELILGRATREWPAYHVREIQRAYGEPLMPDMTDPEGPNSRMMRAAAEEFLEKKAADLDVIPDLELNWRRIDTESDVQEVLNKTIAIFENPELAAKGRQSNEMTIRLADDLGMTADGLIKANGGKAFSATEVTAMRWLHLSSARKLLETAKIAARSTDEADAFTFRKQLATHYAIQCQFYKYRAEAGRALNAWKIQARESETMMRELSEALQQTGGAGTARDMALKILALERPEQISAFTRQAHQATTMDMALEAWINGLLTNPTTHVVNVAGNTASMAWQIPERWLAAKISRVLDPQQEIYEGEAKQMLYGMVQGFKDALMLTVRGKDAFRKAGQEMSQMDLASAKDTLRKALDESREAEMPIFGQGETAGDFGPAWKALISGDQSGQFGKMETARKLAITGENVKANFPRLADIMQKNGFDLSLAMDFLGEMIRTPGRMLMVEDEFFKSGAYRMELHARAFREASKEGLTGEAFSRKVQEFIANPPQDLKLAAMENADYLTFTSKLHESENLFSKASGKLQEMANAAPALRFIVPFIRTPVNIFAFTMERTPLGLFMKSVRNDIFSGSGAERALAIARMSLGSMLMATAYELVMSDMITGGGPGDPELREAKRRAGWLPYSIKVGGQYVSYNRLDPFGSIVGMAADAAEMWNHIQGEGSERDREKMATMVIASLAKNLVNKTYMEGFARIVDVIHDPQRYGEGWMKQFLGSFVPSGVAHLERLTDPTISETQGVLDAIKARIPGLSQALPPKRNLWGEVIHFQGALGPDVVSPFYQSREAGSPIDDEIVRNRVDSIRTPTARSVFAGVELTPQQISRFQEIMGQEVRHNGLPLKDYLNNLIQAPEYQEMTDGPMGGKAFQITRVVHQFREEAKNLMIHEDPELRMRILGIKARKVEARTGTIQTAAGGGMPVFQ